MRVFCFVTLTLQKDGRGAVRHHFSKEADTDMSAARPPTAMVSAGAPLKARLQQKARLRPHRMMRKKMPDGAGLLGKLPERLEFLYFVGGVLY